MFETVGTATLVVATGLEVVEVGVQTPGVELVEGPPLGGFLERQSLLLHWLLGVLLQ